MSRPTPAFVYALAILLILWLVVGAITLPNATKWFKGVPARIQQDIVVIPANGTSISTRLHLVHGEWKYSEKLVTSDNLPNPPDEGMQGMLYDRGNSCSIKLPDLIPFHVPSSVPAPVKVALIKRSDCPFSQQLLNAQQDGAKAAIVYDNVSFENDPRAKYGMEIPPDTVDIPAFYVDLSVGLELFARLQNISGNDNSIPGQEKLQNDTTVLTRVTLFPLQKPRLDPWQFALIIIGVVVVTSLAIIVAMQCHLWRIGRGRGRLDNNDMTDDENEVQDGFGASFTAEERFWRELMSQDPNFVYRPPQKNRLPPELLDALPTHVVGEKDVAEESSQSSVKSNTRSIPLNDVSEAKSKPRQQTQLKQATTCVICLDAMEDGEIVRTLPCFHEYHRDCIDTWLTKKSAVCPLCLQPVVTPTAPENACTRQQVLQRQAADYLQQPTSGEAAEMNELVEIYERLTREPNNMTQPRPPPSDIQAAPTPRSHSPDQHMGPERESHQ